MSANQLLASIIVVLAVSLAGVCIVPEQTVQILGFGGMIEISLLGQIRQLAIAHKVETVRKTLEENPPATQGQLSHVANEIAVVKRNTNGLVDQIEIMSRKEGFAAGVKSETDKLPHN